MLKLYTEALFILIKGLSMLSQKDGSDDDNYDDIDLIVFIVSGYRSV